MLSIENLSFRAGQQLILHRLSLQIPHGQFACLLGPSGCGKTTLLRLIAGFERPREGRIILGEKVLSDASSWISPPQRCIGMVFQQPTLFAHMTVAKNIAYGLTKSEQAAQRTAQLLAHIGLENKANAYPHELSGGQQHRVALARALAPQPDLLLLDESFSHLDPARRQSLRQETRELTQKEGVTCLLVTHDAAEAMQLGEQLLVMNEAGHLLQSGAPGELYHAPRSVAVAQALGELCLFDAQSDAGMLKQLTGENFATVHGKNFKIATRPHHFRLQANAEEAKAQIASVVCAGPHDQLTIRLEGKGLPVHLPSGHGFQAGQMVAVSLDAAHCLSLEE